MIKAIKRLFQLLVLLPIGIVLILLAVANRHEVKIALDPFSPEAPALQFDIPLYIIMFGAILVGVFIGGMMSWFKQGRHRRAAREKRYEAQKWRNEADRQQKRIEKMSVEANGSLPALPAPGMGDDAARPAA